jgi:hypothetical protein
MWNGQVIWDWHYRIYSLYRITESVLVNWFIYSTRSSTYRLVSQLLAVTLPGSFPNSDDPLLSVQEPWCVGQASKKGLTTLRKVWFHLRRCEEVALFGSRYEVNRTHLRAHHQFAWKRSPNWPPIGYFIKKGTKLPPILMNRAPNRRLRLQYPHSLLWGSRTIQPDRWLKGPLALQLDRTACSQRYDQSDAYKDPDTQFKFELYPNHVLTNHLVSVYSPIGPMKFTLTKIWLTLLIYVFI